MFWNAYSALAVIQVTWGGVEWMENSKEIECSFKIVVLLTLAYRNSLEISTTLLEGFKMRGTAKMLHSK